MLNVHYAIDLWLEVCSRPQPARGVVGQATVSGALGIVNLADQQFAELRGRLNELIPPDIVLGPDDCLFTYLGASEVLKVIPTGQIIRGVLSPDKTVVGYCFDATSGQSLRFELVQVSGSATPRVSVSLFDNPTAFIGTGRALSEGTLSVGPLIITATGRYLLIVSHDNPSLGQPITSDFGVLISDVTGKVITGPGLIEDETTGELKQVDPSFVPVITPLAVTATPGQSTAVICPSLTATCDMFTSCAEALACYNLGLTRLDEDADGVPCDLLCGG
jgi:hypothetical protein